MVVKKYNIISIALLLALAATPVTGAFAEGGNDLVQLDLKRASNDSVNVTLYTSNSYNDNILVRKKSDNKYVILIPKVQTSGYNSASLVGVKDLVSNVDVKTVNDTNGGYTKVTLITTKPLDIKTTTQKSSPITDEQQEYKALIAQANAIKKNVAPPEKQVTKTQVTVNKTETKKTATTTPKTTQQTQKAEPKVEKKPETKVVKPETIQQKAKKVEPNEQAKKPEIKEVQVNDERKLRRENLAELIQEVKNENLSSIIPQNDYEEVEVINKTNNFNIINTAWTKLQNKYNNTSKKVKIGLLLGLIILSRLFRRKNKNPNKKSFIESIMDRQPILNTLKYNNIVNNENLSWREKYQMYLDESAKPVSRGENKGNYTFIKTPAIDIEQKRQELEKMVSDVAEIQDKVFISEEIESPEDAIQKTIKFKAFDNSTNPLGMSKREKIKSRFKKYENELPLHEQKNIELGDSILHSNPRRLKDANLDVADVKKRIKFKPSEYIMSSVDEYFSILDKETPVIETPRKTSRKNLTNPITKSHNESKQSYADGLIVKSGFNIDNNKGFYIVNLDGKSSLVGKVNEEVFVLKQFDKNVTNPIQVRHDKENVYMVKAGDFKSLVEVNNEKMGVLIEL